MAEAKASQPQRSCPHSRAATICRCPCESQPQVEEKCGEFNPRSKETVMRALLLLAVCLAVAPFAWAQQSLFQSGDGQSAIYLRQSSATFNLGDSKASIGYVHRINIIKTFWGIELYATANSGM